MFYCVRGNHEERPENIPTMEKVWSEDLYNFVYHEPKYPNIYYLMDGHDYLFNEKYHAIVLGGAYSIDKLYRLEREAAGGYGGWFPQEQLSQEERDHILKTFKGESFDLILTHTCPYEWQPRDLFLSFIDQSQVDNSMELWLSEFIHAVNWKVFLCGHFHADRILAPGAQMFSIEVKDLDMVMSYWEKAEAL